MAAVGGRRMRAVYVIQGGKCFYCHRQIWHEVSGRRRVTSDRFATVDHLWPKSRGNPAIGNTVLACRQCNQRKGNRAPTPEEVGRFERLGLNSEALDALEV